jgi:DNA-binding response OmpR family regulator
MTENGSQVKRLLLVEDEEGIGEICSRALQEKGFVVDVAINGVIAEDLLWANKYDLAVLDIRIPLRDGKQVYQYIAEKYPQLVDGVIFITGDIMGGDTQFFLEKSGRPVLLKPFAPSELVEIVESTCGTFSVDKEQ